MQRIALALVLIFTGCTAEAPAGYHVAGPPAALRLETRVQSESYGGREQVGSVQYTNGAGQAAGTAAIYENRTYTETKLLWHAVDGGRAIADEDFFRAVGDEAAAVSSHAYRSRGRWLVRIGVAASLLGAAGMLGGGLGHQINLFVAGAVGLSLGPPIAYFGFAYQHPENHAEPYSRAEEDLSRFRTQHGLSLAVGGHW